MKKMSFALVLILSVFSYALVSCEVPWGATKRYFFEIHNKSDKSLRYGVYENYPDTLVPDSTSLSFRRLDPNDVGKYDSRDKWATYFSNFRQIL